jgi:uncharacterized membrane protein YhaH (DUF805 family)
MLERHSLRDLLFTTKVPIDRRRYWTIGIIGTLLKWLIDTALIWAASGQWHSPLDFLRPFAGFGPRYEMFLPEWCQLALILVTIPCFFISLSVSVRRAIDIGISPIWGFATGVPPLRLLAIVGLALLPSGLKKPMTRLPSDELHGNKFRSTVLAVAGATLVGLIATLVFVYGKGSYGLASSALRPWRWAPSPAPYTIDRCCEAPRPPLVSRSRHRQSAPRCSSRSRSTGSSVS